MKKQLFIFFTLAIVSLISFTSCEPFIENKITIKNYSESPIKLMIRANEYNIAARVNLSDPVPQIVLDDFKKGSFEYETVYGIPTWASEVTIEGDYAGTMNLNAGTEILLAYYGGVSDSSYIIFASLTSSDDINRPDPFDDDTTP